MHIFFTKKAFLELFVKTNQDTAFFGNAQLLFEQHLAIVQSEK